MRGLLIAGLICCCGAGWVSAQAPVNTAPPVDPYVRELILRSKDTNESLATAISDAIRVKLDDLASSFLTSLAGRKLDPQATANLARQISPDRLLRVLNEPTYTEAAKTQAAAMLKTLRSDDESPERILPAMERLYSESPDEKLPALRIVLAGGNQSIKLLSVAVAKQQDDAKRDELLRVMLRLGEGGPAAVRQLAIYGDDAIRAGALAALIRIGEQHARDVVVAAAHDSNSTAAETTTAENWLKQRYHGVPSRADAEAYLVDRLASRRAAIAFVPRDDATSELWTIDDDRVSVSLRTVSTINAAWREVIDAARLFRRLGSLSPAAVQSGVAAELAYRYQLDPLLLSEAGKDVALLWGEDSVTAMSLAALIKASIEQGDLVVAVAAIEMLDASMAEQADLLLTTYSAVMTTLVAAASHPEPRLRYHAAAAIGRLGFSSPFAGSSDVLKRWIEMIGLTREPIVMLVETRIEVAGQIESLLASMGFRVEIVSSVEDAVLAVDAGGDLRYLISTTVLPDRSSLELVDAVRRRPLGKHLPIILHGPADKVVEVATSDARWPTPVVHIELPASAAGWSLILEPLDNQRLLPALTTVERFDFRTAAADALGQIASQPDLFEFYEFDKLAGAAVSRALADDESPRLAFGEARLAVLSVTASRDAQSALADMAISKGGKPPRREAAADALLFSIEQAGVLLESNDLLRLTRTRQTLDSESGKAIDRVLAEIGRRSDVGGVSTGSMAAGETSQSTEKRVSPPDI